MKRSVLAPTAVTIALVGSVVAGESLPASAVVTAGPAAAVATWVTALADPGIVGEIPVRLLNTRTGLGVIGGGTSGLAAGASLDLAVGLPAGAVVSLDVAASGPAGAGALVVYPTGAARPAVSSLSYPPGPTVSNLVVAKVGVGGRVRVTNLGKTAVQVIADREASLPAAGQYTPVSPARVVDTRSGLGAPLAPVGAGGVVNVQVAGRGGVPATGAVAVVVNLTGVVPSTATAVAAFATGSAPATSTALSLAAGVTRSNEVVVPLSADGRLSLRNGTGSVNLVADIDGWFARPGSYVPQNPYRIVDTRTGLGAPKAKLGPKAFLGVTVLDPALAAPVGAASVVLAVTAVKPTASTFLAVAPGGLTPTTSALSVSAGGTVTTTVIAPVSGSTLALYNAAGSTDVTVDVLGWSVNPLTVMPPRFAEATVGVRYRQQFGAGSGQGTVRTWAATGPLPAGFTLTPGGVLSGTATSTSSLVVPVKVTDEAGATATATVTIPVVPAAPAATWAWGSIAITTVPTGVSGNSTPVQLHGLTGVVDVAGGAATAFARKSDGTVWAWGSNNVGQTGTAAFGLVITLPTQISTLANVVSIAGGNGNGYAVKADGTAWSWGSPAGLGTGSTSTSAGPVQIPGLTGITKIAASTGTAYALKADGTVWAWGANSIGQLGNGTLTSSATPVQVSGLTGITDIAASPFNGYAVGAGGTAWVWGRNVEGEIGDGTTGGLHLTPSQVPGLAGVSSLANGAFTSYALKSDGTVWAWGQGTHGELGNGTTLNSPTPAAVPNLTGATHLSAGFDTAAVVKADGSVWTWGGPPGPALITENTPDTNLVPVRATLLPRMTTISLALPFGLAIAAP